MQDNETNESVDIEKRILSRLVRIEGSIQVIREDYQEGRRRIDHIEVLLKWVTASVFIMALGLCIEAIITFSRG